MKVDRVIYEEKRKLTNGHLVGYRSYDGIEANSLELPNDAGQILGVYDNDEEGKIFVTLQGLILLNDIESKLLRYSDIKTVNVLGDNKHTAECISLEFKNGNQSTISIRKGHDRFRDVWQFCRYLRSVVSDPDQNPLK